MLRPAAGPTATASGSEGLTIHEAAAQGFERNAEAFERGRPDYPVEAVAILADRIGIGPGSTVVDLAAGTGKFTRRLLPIGARVFAVEPVEAMRRTLALVVPGAAVLAGTAEAIPLPTGFAHAVTVAQAFHWFATPEALAEIHRVLSPGGGLGLVWNRRSIEEPFEGALHRLINEHRGGVPAHMSGEWRRVFESTELFGPVGDGHVPNVQVLDSDGMSDRVLSTSFVANLPDDQRAALLDRVKKLWVEHGEPGVLRYVTDVHWCIKQS